ncbi:MAG TPA: hypothetical protein VEF89_14410 [Solirubrobacteraceae bacterium]|nr:hypothetical protein [Solirubrobacteraceae bacterium]
MRTGLALTAAALALGCFACSAVASMITWSSPVLIDQRLPFVVPLGLIDVACPSVHLCVGTQASGVEISTNPLGGASTWAITALPVTPGTPLSLISCASPRLCVAVGDSGQVFTSTDPTGGAGAWKGTTVGSIFYPTDVSCPRLRFCVVVDQDGVLVSTRPTRPHSWRLIRVSSVGELSSMACPSRRLCVGVASMDGAGPGGITWTSRPTGPGRDWKTPVHRDYDFDEGSIACPSTRLCVALTGGTVFTSTDPARGRWKIGDIGGTWLDDVSCPSVHLCVSVGPRSVAVSTHPAGGARTWRITHQRAFSAGIGSLTCASGHLCLATNNEFSPGGFGPGGEVGDLVFATANPAAGAAAWSSSFLDQGYDPLTAIACPSEQLCLGSDGAGNLVTSNAPAATAAAWNLAPLAIGRRTYPMSSLACPSASWCAAISNESGLAGGVLLTSADPANAGAWTSTPLPFADVSCPTAMFCAGSDYLGKIHISSSPSGGPSAWSSQQLGAPEQCSGSVGQYCSYDSLTAVSCPSISFCATTDGNDIWTSTDPSTPGAVWSKSPLPKLLNPPNLPDGISALYCPTQSLCLAASSATLETTSDPADPSPMWTAANLPKVFPTANFASAAPLGSISDVSCVSVQLCVAVDQAGGYAFVGDPSDPNSWTATKIDYSSPALAPVSLTGVSCTPSGRCVAVDGSGNLIVGTTSG